MKLVALGLLLSITTMMVIGIVMLFSTGSFSRDAFKVRKHKAKTVEVVDVSATASEAKKEAADNAVVDEAKGEKEILWDPACLVKRQAIWLVIGLVVCIAAALVDYRFWQKTWPYLFGLAVLLLLACFAFPKINGSHRWIRFGSLSFQPSEIGKIASIAFLAAWFHRYADESGEFLKGIVFPLMIVGGISCLCLRWGSRESFLSPFTFPSGSNVCWPSWIWRPIKTAAVTSS